MNKYTVAAMAVFAALFSNASSAEIRFNGFASIVGGVDLDDDVPFREVLYDDDFGFSEESKFALQAVAEISDGFSATAQIMARGQNDFDAEFEWAYISYAINDSNTIRAGRLRIPFYNYSDFLDVGYAYPWLRTPSAMYNLLFSAFDGVSWLNYSLVGDWDITSQAFFGSTKDTFFPRSTPTEGTVDWLGINIQGTMNEWTLYGAYIHVPEVNIPIIENNFARLQGAPALSPAQQGQLALFSGLTATGELGGLSLDGDEGYFVGVGSAYDNGTIRIAAEYSVYDVDDSLLPETVGWYVHGGYRIGAVTPHITYMARDYDIDNGEVVNNFTGPALQGGATAVITSQTQKWSSIILGVRYDFATNAAFKINYITYDIDEDPGNPAGAIFNDDDSEFTIGIDLVF